MSKVDFASSLSTSGQFPLDGKLKYNTLAELQDLGTDDVNAFRYYEDMIVQCIENHTQYMWRERVTGDGAGVLSSDFTYPNGAIANGIDYSNRSFNFFEYKLGASTLQEVTDGGNTSTNSIVVDNTINDGFIAQSGTNQSRLTPRNLVVNKASFYDTSISYFDLTNLKTFNLQFDTSLMSNNTTLNYEFDMTKSGNHTIATLSDIVTPDLEEVLTAGTFAGNKSIGGLASLATTNSGGKYIALAPQALTAYRTGGTSTFESEKIKSNVGVQDSIELRFPITDMTNNPTGAEVLTVPYKTGTIATLDDIPNDYLPLSGGNITGDLIIDPANSGTNIAQSIFTIKKDVSSESGINATQFIDVARSGAIVNTSNTIANVSRVINSSTASVDGITAINMVGRYTGSGGGSYIYGSLTEADYQGSGNFDFVSAHDSNANITGSGAGVIDYVRIINNHAEIDNPNITINNLQGDHTTLSFKNGTVGDAYGILLDVDYDNTGNSSVTGDLAYLRIQNDVLPPITGNGYAIKSYSTLPSEFDGKILAESFEGDGCRLTNVGVFDRESTNLVTYSEDITNVGWQKLGLGTATITVTGNQGTAPDGTTTADRVQLNLNGGTASGDRSIVRFTTGSGTPGVFRVFSFYVKSNTGTDQTFSLHTGSEFGSYTATNEWQRIEYKVDNSSIVSWGIALKGNISSVDSADLLFWGAQVEIGEKPTGYKKTAGTTVTTEEGINTSWRTVQAEKFVKNNATNDDVLLGDGSTTSLLGIKDTLPTGFYEEGTFTPTLTDDGGGATYSASTFEGKYRRIGDLVYIMLRISPISTSGTPTGNLRIGSLPFTAGDLSYLHAESSNSNINYISLKAQINSSTDYLSLRYKNSSTSGLSSVYNSVTFTSGDIYVTGTYFTNTYTP